MVFPEVNKSNKTVIYLLIVFTGIIILKNAWVGDDAYIGFRTVFNFTHGYGLRFNINERVQSFTNPLWILFMSFLYLFTGEAYFTSILLSLTITLFFLYFLTVKFSDGILTTLLIFALASSSKAFMDYSTSGLENPLGHMFIVFFVSVYFSEIHLKKKLFLLFFIASLAAINRLDNLLLYIVPLLIQLKYISKKNILIMLAGFLPLLFWEGFALLYFGFPFPNTYYTKLNTGLPGSEYTMQGIRYLINSLDLDAITLFSIITAVIVAITYTFKNKKYKLIPFVLSILIYIYYTIKVGGDFMSGRFLTYPFLISIILFTQIVMEQTTKVILLSFVGMFIALSPLAPPKTNSQYRIHEITEAEILNNDGIADERAWYFASTGLMNLNSHLYIQNIEKTLDSIQTHHDSILAFIEAPVLLGFSGYSVGPNIYIFHHMGLSDPLISRLPRDEDTGPYWRIGHIHRKIPDGYIETLRTGKNQIADKNLALFFDKLQIITKGDLFNWSRLETIFKMNTGQFDFLINKKFYSSEKNR